MARKKLQPEHANHERWLISYADFITLMFAFFVVMFASSQTDKGKAQQVSDSVKRAIDGDHVAEVIAAVLGGVTDQKGQGNAMMKGPGGVEQMRKQLETAELTPSYQVLIAELKKEIDAGEIEVSMQTRGLVISFTQAALFPSGGDEVSPDAFGGLAKVAGAIAKVPNPVRLEGHTDARPISTARFKSNWELSSARAIALLEILSGRFDLPRSRMSIAGYAETAPIGSNDTEQGRARNRRVDIVLLNGKGSLGEPLKDAGPLKGVTAAKGASL
jgi:chemotaxis protein MotB